MRTDPISELVDVASGLRFPEGPIALDDGSFLVVEIAGGTLTRVSAKGEVAVVADIGGGPNGAALGPDGRCYVCNNGGVQFHERNGRLLPGFPPDDHSGGWIEAVDLASGDVERLYDHCASNPLTAPNDIVFDKEGGFWFTDLGLHHRGRRVRDLGAVYYALPDGSLISQQIFPLEGPNGIGLSPDERKLYVSESLTGRVWAFDLEAPGRVANYANRPPWRRGELLWTSPEYAMFDSLAVDADGYVYVADIPYGGISVIAPDGQLERQIAMPDELTTNICFGGPDNRQMYITLSSSGKLATVRAPRRGLRLNFAR